MENWKSTGAFILFIGAYMFTLAAGKPVDMVEVTGGIALYSSLFMMFRSDFTKEMFSKVIDKINIGKR